MRKAYLVATIDTSLQPCVVKRCGYYSSNAGGLTAILRTEFHVDIVFAEAETFELATAKLKQLTTEAPYSAVFGWAAEMVPEWGGE